MKYITFFILTVFLSACNNEDIKDNIDNSNDMSISIKAKDSFVNVTNGDEVYIDLMSKVESNVTGSYISDVTSLNSSQQCQNYVSDSKGTLFSSDSDFVGLCSFKYEAQNQLDSNADAFGYSLVSVQGRNSIDTQYFPPISRVGQVFLPVSVSLRNALEGEIPEGYTLDEGSVTVLGSGSIINILPDHGDLIQFVSPDIGISRIAYSYSNGSDLRVGIVAIAMSDGANSIPSATDTTYPIVLEVDATETINLADYISDPDGDPLQLIYVNTWRADVTPTNYTDPNNISFDFTASTAGSHIVTYGISDHRGGYNIGLMEVRVINPAGMPSWDDIKIGDKIYYHPTTREEAVSKGEEFLGTFIELIEGTPVWMTLYNTKLAEQLCAYKGRVPNSEEIKELANVGGIGVNPHDSWPVGHVYMVNDDKEYSSADISSTVPKFSKDIPTIGTYVTCVADLGFIIDRPDSKLEGVANGVDQAFIELELTLNGVPLVEKAITASISETDSSAVLSSGSLLTDSNGGVIFRVTDTRAEKVTIVFDFEGRQRTQEVKFIGDKATAQIKQTSVLLDHSAITAGSYDAARVLVTDAYDNPVEGQSVVFETSNPDTYVENTLIETGSGGEVDSRVYWNGPTNYAETQTTELVAKTWSEEVGVSQDSIILSYEAGKLTDFWIENNHAYWKTGVIELYTRVELYDGSPSFGDTPVHFETFDPNAKIINGKLKDDSSGWEIFQDVNSDGTSIAQVGVAWIGPEPDDGDTWVNVKVSFGDTEFNDEIAFFKLGICEKYDATTGTSAFSEDSVCLPLVEPEKDGVYVSGPINKLTAEEVFGMVQLSGEDFAVDPIANDPDFRSYANIQGSGDSGHGSIPTWVLSMSMAWPESVSAPSGDQPFDSSQHQASRYCNLLSTYNMGDRGNWKMFTRNDSKYFQTNVWKDDYAMELSAFQIFTRDLVSGGTHANYFTITPGPDFGTPTTGMWWGKHNPIMCISVP